MDRDLIDDQEAEIKRLEEDIRTMQLRIDEQSEVILKLRTGDDAARVEALVSERVRDELIEILRGLDSGRVRTTCFHCGLSHPLDSPELKAHVMTCADNPLVKRIKQLEEQLATWKEVSGELAIEAVSGKEPL